MHNRNRRAGQLRGSAGDEGLHGAGVGLLETAGDRPRLAVADRAPVHTDHRQDLRGGAADEKLCHLAEGRYYGYPSQAQAKRAKDSRLRAMRPSSSSLSCEKSRLIFSGSRNFSAADFAGPSW